MSVVDLAAERLARTAHRSGPAQCLGCGHRFELVAPIDGPDVFDCPSCTLEKAVFAGLCVPDDDETFLMCECGGSHFLVVNESCPQAFCIGCGARLDPFEL